MKRLFILPAVFVFVLVGIFGYLTASRAGKNQISASGLYSQQINTEINPFEQKELVADDYFTSVVLKIDSLREEKQQGFGIQASSDGNDWTNEIAVNFDEFVGSDPSHEDSKDPVGNDVLIDKSLQVSSQIYFQGYYKYLRIINHSDENVPLVEAHVLRLETNIGGTDIAATGETYNYNGVSVVSRKGWGCNDFSDGNDPGSPYYCDGPFWGTNYANTTHITVHHTATDNTSNDWASVVRAIWYNHSHIRDADPDDGIQGWTDIGYQFLIDPNGIIYEGRYGVKNMPTNQSPVGGHVLGSNVGNIGISMIGTYTNVNITPKAKTSLENLIQAIINQKQLDPFKNAMSASGQTHRVISGHRDWSATACPGNMLYTTVWNSLNYTGPVGDNEPVYRFLNKRTKVHFYTASSKEKNFVNNILGSEWKYEGTAFYAPTNAIPDADVKNVYRFLNKELKVHFYTASAKERDFVRNNLSSVWDYEGVAFKAYKSDVPDVEAVYRFLNRRLKVHFYTQSVSERDYVKNNLSSEWKYEGTAFHEK